MAHACRKPATKSRSDDASILLATTRENPSLECVSLGRRELANRVGIAESLLAVSPYTVYLHLLGLKAPGSNLAPATVTAGYSRAP